MVRIDQYRILIIDVGETPPFWCDLGEGPWDNLDDACRYAHCEVGMPWVIVNGKGEPVAFGDARGIIERNYSA